MVLMNLIKSPYHKIPRLFRIPYAYMPHFLSFFRLPTHLIFLLVKGEVTIFLVILVVHI